MSGFPPASLMTSTNRRGAAAFPTHLVHRLPSLNSVVLVHPRPSHGLRRAERKEAVSPDGDPLRVIGRNIGLEETKLLLGVQSRFTTSVLWRFMKAADLPGHS